MKTLFFLLWPLLLAPALQGEEVVRSQHLMGTLCEITVRGTDKAALNQAVSKAFDEIRRIENRISTYNKDSELSRLNETAGAQPVAVSDELFYLITKAQEGWDTTRGAFDAALQPLMTLWADEKTEPTKKEIKKALSQSSMKKIRIDHDTKQISFKNDNVGLDFGGFGKGYALDQAKLILLQDDVDFMQLNFGGQILIWTKEEAAPPTPVLISHPTDPRKKAAELFIRRGSIATSSQHFQSHVLNPKTGRPIETQASVTVVANSATEADLFSTAGLILDSNPREDLCFIRLEAQSDQLDMQTSRACTQLNLTEKLIKS